MLFAVFTIGLDWRGSRNNPFMGGSQAISNKVVELDLDLGVWIRLLYHNITYIELNHLDLYAHP